jgi:hypothetical protein
MGADGPYAGAGLANLAALALVAIGACICPLTVFAGQHELPHFYGQLMLTPLVPDDGRHFKLAQPYGFVTDDGVKWPVPKGAVTDGASIPSLLWSFVGGPFEGKYRSAAVIHDYYCDVRVRTWQTTDLMFYEAMVANGVDEDHAKLMYFAVRRWGPHWDQQTIINSNIPFPTATGSITNFNADEFVIIPKSGGGAIRLTQGLAAEAWHVRDDSTIHAGTLFRARADVPNIIFSITSPTQGQLDQILADIKTKHLTVKQIEQLTEQ